MTTWNHGISAISATDAYSQALRLLSSEGKHSSPRGRKTIELIGLQLVIQKPRARRITAIDRKWSEALAIGELCWHLSAADAVEPISYYAKNWANFAGDSQRIKGSCYGKHIFESDRKTKLSQWEVVIDELKRDQFSRRAILYMPNLLSNGSNLPDIPCISNIQFIIRDQKLICLNNMRSNDIVWGFCYDVYFVTFLQEYLSLILGLELGPYIHNVGSLHIYERFTGHLEKSISSDEIDSGSIEMPRLSDINQLDMFLDIEKRIREGDKCAIGLVQQLPNYWKELANVLLDFRSKKAPKINSKFRSN